MMTLSPIVLVAGLVVLALVLLVLLVVAYTQLRDKRQGYPYEARVEAALLPWVYRAIMAAYKASEYALDEFGRRLHGADKAQLARTVYELLPERIEVAGAIVPVKAVIGQAEFERMIADAFDGFLVFYDENCGQFENAVIRWAKASKT